MVSKSQIKLIKSLAQKKYRNKHGLFVVEGKKGVSEFLNSEFQLDALFTSGETFGVAEEKVFRADESELKKISFLKTPQVVLAIFKMPDIKFEKSDQLSLVLDGVRDPGNLGTIIRLCDWFGIEDLICSKDTVDCFNPKVVQASMGSLTRVKVIYEDLSAMFENNGLPVYGALLEGENVYSENLPEAGFLVMGNEANGISAEILKYITHKISIPQFGKVQETESLNVATATAVLLSEFRRNSIEK
ncbi:TrmH family RNA methyltransferase [Christiangramia salexigens]|uniref:RNA methyltransferase n=1 Tax=Christiangramia salexigens TaxID=1913577 RepID=A0A1L3J528_9FLAO|nr:RNA methyltransferase [Christiangramia salexigens]APG60226.1 RNA methyltransferase [Christiangramia salexigens]